MNACRACRTRALTLDLLSPYIENARNDRSRLTDVLALDDERLARAVGGRRAAQLITRIRDLQPGEEPAVCPHDGRFPELLRADPTVAALHLHGRADRLLELTAADRPAVAIVGTRRASPEGLGVARELGRGLAAAGVTVVSGMALGIDSAAHEGALEGGGETIAVLACGADVSYPRSKAALHRRITASGCVVSEMPPGATARKWGFPARNRIIAGLSQATIVVEAAKRSGSLITAEFALELGREVLAVPGSVRSWRADGTNLLIRDGAMLVRDARDVLDAVLGAEMSALASARAAECCVAPPPDLGRAARVLLGRIEAGISRTDELLAAAEDRTAALAELSELEVLGLIARRPGGGYERLRV